MLHAAKEEIVGLPGAEPTGVETVCLCPELTGANVEVVELREFTSAAADARVIEVDRHPSALGAVSPETTDLQASALAASDGTVSQAATLHEAFEPEQVVTQEFSQWKGGEYSQLRELVA